MFMSSASNERTCGPPAGRTGTGNGVGERGRPSRGPGPTSEGEDRSQAGAR